MRVLITGGLGFIGAWTARVLFAQGHDVRTVDVHGERALFDADTQEMHSMLVQ